MEKRETTSLYFDEGVKLISFCPLCEASYEPTQAKVLGEKEDSHLLHIVCGNCSNAVIALVMISTVGVSTVGMCTDLDFSEVMKFTGRPAIHTDDVIDIHRVLDDEAEFFDACFLATEPPVA